MDGGINLYAYVGGDPLNLYDFMGLLVTNDSDVSIWVKPEDNTKKPLKIKPGGQYPDPVDAVTYPRMTGGQSVYKITDPYADSNITVYCGGVNLPGPDGINWAAGGGTLKEPPDSGWKDIFKKADSGQGCEDSCELPLSP